MSCCPLQLHGYPATAREMESGRKVQCYLAVWPYDVISGGEPQGHIEKLLSLVPLASY